MNRPLDDRRVWMLSVAGGLTMFLVQPPADLWILAWLAPLPWLAIVEARGIAAGRPWRAIWAGGFLHWLLTIHWLRLPHPATSIGWVALSLYLACFVPLFVWVARGLVHRWGWPLAAAAPLAWVACEHLRGSLFGGFTFANLGHTQWRSPMLIQAADLCGAVGVSGLVMLVAAAVLSRSMRQATAAACVMIAALAYGAWRLAEEPRPTGRPLDVLLVQGSIDTELKHEPAAAADVARHYDELTVAGLRATPDDPPDLIAWPETMWRWSLLEIDPAETLPESVVEQMLGSDAPEVAGAAEADRQRRCREALEAERLAVLAAYARRYATNWLVGVDRQEITPSVPSGARNFNCGLFLDATGTPLARYDKMHPVLFGEYIPLANRFPWLYRLTPLPAGLTAGTEDDTAMAETVVRRSRPSSERSCVNTMASSSGVRSGIVLRRQ